MIIANNATSKLFVSDYNNQTSKLQSSMSKLASGNRLLTPGEAPADLGISERFRNQFRSSGEANRVIQNAINMFQTTDSWLQEGHDIINRMSELAISAADNSKSQSDRVNLNLEFQQLKTEVGRISEAGKYNGLQINGRQAVAVWDNVEKTIVYMQADGSDKKDIGTNLRFGATNIEGKAYAFETATGGVGDFVFTKDGKSLLYMAQATIAGTSTIATRTLMNLDVETNTLKHVNLTSTAGLSSNVQSRIVMDEKGRVWVSTATTGAVAAAGNSGFDIKLLRLDSMTIDSGGSAASNAWAGGAKTASGFSLFTVHNDYMYYFSSTAPAVANGLSYVKQNIYDSNDREVLLSNMSAASTFSLNRGETYTISSDGQYIAFEDVGAVNRELRVINTFTGEMERRSVGLIAASTNVAAIDFDRNNNVYWTDTGRLTNTNAVKRMKIAAGETPTLSDEEIIYRNNLGRVGAANSGQAATGMGMRISGGTPAGRYQFQIGPDAGMKVDFVAANITQSDLGISDLKVLDFDQAQKAIAALSKASDMVSNQRAVIGSEVSRLNHIYSANEAYGNSISQAESRIRDVDFAAETTRLTAAQVASQAALSIITQSNAAKQNVLSLLR